VNPPEYTCNLLFFMAKRAGLGETGVPRDVIVSLASGIETESQRAQAHQTLNKLCTDSQYPFIEERTEDKVAIQPKQLDEFAQFLKHSCGKPDDWVEDKIRRS